MSRDLHKVVDILFAPYNYLIDPGNRRSLSIEWNDSILIFDEAHNLVSGDFFEINGSLSIVSHVIVVFLTILPGKMKITNELGI